MAPVEVDKVYIISLKNVSTDLKPPALTEWCVKVIKLCELNLDRVYVKYLSGTPQDIGKEKYISLKYFDVQEYEKNKSIEQQFEFIKGEFERIKTIDNEIRANTEEHTKFFEEMKQKIEYYKGLETEVMFLRGAILLIVYMYIMGMIRFI